MSYLFTSESVTAWHPDKICDQISDAILDAYLAQDPYSRVACECLVTTDTLILAGEITSQVTVDHAAIARNIIVNIWYNREELLFDGNTCRIEDLIHTQSPDIALGVDTGGAGDQWIMFGYACDETPDLLPAPLWYAHRLAQQLHTVRSTGKLSYLRPDGKTQVTCVYDDHGLVRIHTIVISSQHDPEVTQEMMHADLLREVILPVVGDLVDDQTIYHINPTGQFIIWGPHGDTGLTGRKIIVDSYGGVGRHWWWAFSGKDPTKVDRSAAYMARYLAKSVVAKCRAKKCEIQLSYVIWVAEPVSIFIETFGTESYKKASILERILETFDLTPTGIITFLDLRKPIYTPTAAYGHFGRPWFSREEIETEE